MIKKIILLLILISCLNGCTRDDICSEATATTPLLIITFKDITNPLVAKSVENLTIDTDYTNSVRVIDGIQTDSIGLPLRPGANSARFRFILNAGETNEITDVYEFNYEREDIYVNRACGFKTIYNSLTATEDDEGLIDWIINLNILKTTVENEIEAHITILH